MPIKVSRVPATGGVLATTSAQVHGLHWVGATGGAGTVTLRDGVTATAASVAVFDTPAARVAGSVPISGGGVRFHSGVFASLSNSGGASIVYYTP